MKNSFLDIVVAQDPMVGNTTRIFILLDFQFMILGWDIFPIHIQSQILYRIQKYLHPILEKKIKQLDFLRLSCCGHMWRTCYVAMVKSLIGYLGYLICRAILYIELLFAKNKYLYFCLFSCHPDEFAVGNSGSILEYKCNWYFNIKFWFRKYKLIYKNLYISN